MKTDPKILSSFLAAAVWADGEYDEFEKEFVADLAGELEIPTLTATLEAAIKETEKMTEEELAAYLEDPKNRQAIISRQTMTDFDSNEQFLRNRAII